MRNPFPMIGKVMKYDFKHSARKLLPLYGALLVLGLLTGLFANPPKINEADLVAQVNESSVDLVYSSGNHPVSRREIFFVLLAVITAIFSVVCVVMTFSAIERRFRQSMLEDEAYLNLSLPVTMGEHLWGKLIMGFLWFFCCAIVNMISGLFCFIRMGLPDFFKNLVKALPTFNSELAAYNLTVAKCIWLMLLMAATTALFFITLIYVVNSVAHLFKKGKGLVKFVTVVVLFYINGWLFKLLPAYDSTSNISAGNSFALTVGLTSLILFLVSAVYFAVTQVIFTKELNLE